MFSTSIRSSSPINASQRIQAVRSLKRRLAYPQKYKPKVAPPTHPKKDHSSFFHRHLKEWLGPMNIRGEYYRNKYYYPPQSHKPNYIVPDGNTVVDNNGQQFRNERSYNNPSQDPSLHPFPQNPHCRTSLMISDEVKAQIYSDVTESGMHVQEVAHKYGIKMPRVEAIIKLQNIEKSWEEEQKISEDMKSFANVMYKMFPLYKPPVDAENLTEIPTPQKTLHQRFLTISESEPFGPVDAAKLFQLEPAQETLNKLTEFNEDQESNHVKLNKVFVSPRHEGDRSSFKFTASSSGDVGYRYGASRRDRKKDRAIGFDRAGRMVYL